MRIAYLYRRSRTMGGYALYILAEGEHQLGRAGEQAFMVSGKREARAICKEHNAKPHNF